MCSCFCYPFRNLHNQWSKNIQKPVWSCQFLSISKNLLTISLLWVNSNCLLSNSHFCLHRAIGIGESVSCHSTFHSLNGEGHTAKMARNVIWQTRLPIPSVRFAHARRPRLRSTSTRLYPGGAKGYPVGKSKHKTHFRSGSFYLPRWPDTPSRVASRRTSGRWSPLLAASVEILNPSKRRIDPHCFVI